MKFSQVNSDVIYEINKYITYIYTLKNISDACPSINLSHKVKTLKCDVITSNNAIKQFINLTSLLCQQSAVTNDAFIHLTSLQTLNCSNYIGRDTITNFQHLTQLQILNCSYWMIVPTKTRLFLL